MKRLIQLSDKIIQPAFRHELCHGVESNVWAFFWWLLLTAPHGKNSGSISTIIWSCTTEKEEMGIDCQKLFTMLRDKDIKYNFVHPEYHPFLQLLISITVLIQTNYY